MSFGAPNGVSCSCINSKIMSSVSFYCLHWVLILLKIGDFYLWSKPIHCYGHLYTSGTNSLPALKYEVPKSFYEFKKIIIIKIKKLNYFTRYQNQSVTKVFKMTSLMHLLLFRPKLNRLRINTVKENRLFFPLLSLSTAASCCHLQSPYSPFLAPQTYVGVWSWQDSTEVKLYLMVSPQHAVLL